jgi:hypothetical protein
MRANSKKWNHLPGITVNPNIPDVRNDPYVVKKRERARELIAKHPIPEDLLKKSRRK